MGGLSFGGGESTEGNFSRWADLPPSPQQGKPWSMSSHSIVTCHTFCGRELYLALEIKDQSSKVKVKLTEISCNFMLTLQTPAINSKETWKKCSLSTLNWINLVPVNIFSVRHRIFTQFWVTWKDVQNPFFYPNVMNAIYNQKN